METNCSTFPFDIYMNILSLFLFRRSFHFSNMFVFVIGGVGGKASPVLLFIKSELTISELLLSNGERIRLLKNIKHR